MMDMSIMFGVIGCIVIVAGLAFAYIRSNRNDADDDIYSRNFWDDM